MRAYALGLAATLSLVWIGVVAVTTVVGRAMPPISALSFSINSESRNEIVVFDLDRSLAYPVTDDQTSYGSARWSADGNRLAYIESFGARLRLHVKDFTCRACSFTLSEPMYNYSNPVWTPDSDLLFVSDRELQPEIYRYHFETGVQENLTQNSAYDNNPALSPDGQKMAFVSLRGGDRDIYVLDLNCSDECAPRNLTQHFSDDISPIWSPDGKWIAFISDRTWNYDLFVMDAEGNHQRNLTHSHGEELFPVWSPDSRLIAFMSDRPGNYEIYTVDIFNRRISNITNDLASDISQLWSPDGQRIVFLSNRAGKGYDIYQIDSNGLNLRRITHNLLLGRLSEWRP